MVRRALPSQQVIPQQKQVLTEEPAITYCTACGMRLGTGHRFCGYCGQSSET